jgi:hypothetical protein
VSPIPTLDQQENHIPTLDPLVNPILAHITGHTTMVRDLITTTVGHHMVTMGHHIITDTMGHHTREKKIRT